MWTQILGIPANKVPSLHCLEQHPKTDLPDISLVGIQDVSSQLLSSESAHDNISKPYVSLTNFAKKRIAASKFTVNDDDGIFGFCW